MSMSQIAYDLGITFPTVSKWKKRWESSYANLCSYGDNEEITDLKLFQKIKEILSDKNRIGAPKRISLVAELKIIVIACEEPERHGIPMTHWSHEMLAIVAKGKGIVDTISKSQIGNILKKTN